jgi:broad specificity phosphatase PhoE
LELVKEKVIYESPQELRERIWKVKALLQEYRQKYKRIAIVSHFQVITTLIAREYNE